MISIGSQKDSIVVIPLQNDAFCHLSMFQHPSYRIKILIFYYQFVKAINHAEAFYGNLIDLFQKHKVQFMIGGTYAFTCYTGIERPTKDFDFFCTQEMYPSLLKISSDNGYKTELLDKTWIAKIHKKDCTADIIFAERNGRNSVTQAWYKRAQKGEVFGKKVLLMPVEEMIRSKAFIQERTRYDGADILHLLLKQGKHIDWDYLYALLEKDWELLFSYIMLFSFVFPADHHLIPRHIREKMIEKVKHLSSVSQDNKITRGLLISSEYRVAIEKWGYKEVTTVT